MGKLYFYYSPMNSGKSMLLLAKFHNFKERNIDCVLIKPSVDTRDKWFIKSRALATSVECFCFNSDENLLNWFENNHSSLNPSDKTMWILCDEAQFLTETQVDELAQIVDNHNVNIMCYGLRTDFQTKLFSGSKRLFEIADNIEEIKSTCLCGKRASVNARIDSDGFIVTEGNQVECGSEDRYMTLCRSCYNKTIQNHLNINDL